VGMDIALFQNTLSIELQLQALAGF